MRRPRQARPVLSSKYKIAEVLTASPASVVAGVATKRAKAAHCLSQAALNAASHSGKPKRVLMSLHFCAQASNSALPSSAGRRPGAFEPVVMQSGLGG